jgi:hypothetical protein
MNSCSVSLQDVVTLYIPNFKGGDGWKKILAQCTIAGAGDPAGQKPRCSRFNTSVGFADKKGFLD